MSDNDKNSKLIRRIFVEKDNGASERIRLGNGFIDDFIFEGQQTADIPINALRVIFNIISIIGNEQFRPEDRPKQLSLFDEEFETENNVFASLRIRNNKISPSGSTKQVIDAYEFLARYKMGWYKSVNLKGREIKTFGGLISNPSYDQRGFTTFLISSYWLKKLLVIPEYNYILYNLVYTIRNNKHIIFAIWLSKLPEKGTAIKLSTLNERFGLNYKTTNDFCFKFLKSARINLDQFNNLSFNYKYKKDLIYIIPYYTKSIPQDKLKTNVAEHSIVTRRLNYFKKRYCLTVDEMVQFSYQYRNIHQTREMIEKCFKEFIKNCRIRNVKSTNFKGLEFLNKIQEYIILFYRRTKMGELLPNGYPHII
ncbi:hypothetical protein [Chryseobacterium turcicum]|uniref:Initiator Rep protein domain-containing protein n=1 Tax=Chryseobacterium turcicum TaxID=2898076 RepID=A0A9Q3V389_9FLAO|nr:hypothetical protein [Chryseobacterium turcicum]MCD1117532.1 hypothetical protein [Chryseobacterium turcicum]